MEYSDDLKEKLQKVELDMLKYLKKICEENKINYFLIGGTLLGAVRHGGFIPWDDDIDVGMERSEYERFIKIWMEKYQYSQPDYFLQCKETDHRTPLPYAKIRKNGTLFLEKETYQSELHKGIFIDIFPFDALPQKLTIIFKIKYIIFRLLMVVSEYKNGYRDFNHKLNIVPCMILSLIPYEIINKYEYRFMTQYNDKGIENITSYSSGYGVTRHCCNKNNLCGKNVIKFEDDIFSCPKDNDAYLSHLYGSDYMRIPPASQRQTIHNVIDIKF